MKIKLAIFVTLAALSLGPGSASAATTAYTEAGAFSLSKGAFGGGGFSFKVYSPIRVTELGFYALSIGANADPHVYLWNVTTGKLLADSGSLQGHLKDEQWNYTILPTPITLTPGDTYQIASPAYFLKLYANPLEFGCGSEINAIGFVNNEGWKAGWSQAAPYTNATIAPPVSANFKYEPVSKLPSK